MQNRTAFLSRNPQIESFARAANWIHRIACTAARMRRRDWTVRSLFAFFGLVLLIPTFTLGAIALHGFAEAERQRIEDSSIDLAASVNERVDDELQSLMTILKTLATSPFLDAGDFAAFHKRARLALQETDTYLVLFDSSMQPILNTRNAGAPISLGFSDLETPRAVFKRGRPQISNSFMDTSLGEEAISLAVPVKRQGEVRYVLADIRPTRTLLRHKVPSAAASNWTVTVSDQNDIVLDRTHEADKFIGRLLPDDVRTASAGGSGVQRRLGDGETVLRAYVRSELSGWMTAASIPVNIIEAPLQRSWLLFAFASVALIALCAAVAGQFARFVALPIDALLDDAQALGRGEVVTVRASSLREANVLGGELAQASRHRKRQDEHLRLVMHELVHRSKNLLTLTLSIMSQSHSPGITFDEFRNRVTGRVTALSHSMEILVASDWHGADLAHLTKAVLAPFVDGGKGRLSLVGPEITLNAQAAQQIGLALHELATNATKYGALSVPRGTVRVEWSFVDSPEGDLRLEWQEAGGPRVVAPSKSGFGRVVIEEGIAHAFRTEAKIDYAPAGLRWSIVVPRKYRVGPEGN